jgi:hypothetical protein
MKGRKCYAIVFAMNGSQRPRVEVDSVHKTKKQAEAKLKWLGATNNDRYRIESTRYTFKEEVK